MTKGRLRGPPTCPAMFGDAVRTKLNTLRCTLALRFGFGVKNGKHLFPAGRLIDARGSWVEICVSHHVINETSVQLITIIGLSIA